MALSLNAWVDIIAAPTQVFDSIREKKISSWLPLLVLIATVAAVSGWYFFTIDMYQFFETSMVMSGQDVNPQEIDLILQNEMIIRITSTVFGAIGTVVIWLLYALFFFLAAMLVAEQKLTFGQFFAMVIWASVPTLLSYISIAVSYAAVVPEFVLFQSLDKLSFASLLGYAPEDTYFNLLSGLSLVVLWMFALLGIGFARITQCKPVTATIVTLIPFFVQYGLMALLA